MIPYPTARQVCRRLVASEPRELHVLRGLARGLSKKEIARELGISAETVRSHDQRLKKLLGAHTAAQCVALGFRYGLLGRDDARPAQRAPAIPAKAAA